MTPLRALGVVLLVGCGPTAGTFCAEYVDALDARSVRCVGGDPHQVRALLALGDFCGDYGRALAAKTTTFDSAAASACLDDLKTATCDLTQPPAACRDALSGTAAVGGACHADFECGRGLFCSTVLGEPCPGQCRAYARAGESCAGTTTCLPELMCNTNTLTCAAAAGVGAACGGSTGISCAKPLSCLDGVCAPLKSAGSCTSDAQCDARSRCADGSCVARRKKGEACVDGRRECENGLACNPSSGSTCAEPVAVGQACTVSSSSSDGVSCVGGYCDSKALTCAAFKAPGAPCTPFSFECGLVLCGASGACPAHGGACHVP